VSVVGRAALVVTFLVVLWGFLLLVGAVTGR
jgi:hypothetical protein